MHRFDYAAIAPLIAHREQVDRQIRCVFACTLTGVRAAAGAEIQQPSLLERIAGYLRSWVSDREAEDAVRRKTIEAFQAVADRFHWDELAGCWVGLISADHAGLQGEFQRQLAVGPVTRPRDKRILNRMLAEVALADRAGTGAEQAFLTELAGADAIQPLTNTHPGQPLTPLELDATSRAARPTMLMLAWAVARCDGKHPAEDVLLARFAAAMGLAGTPADTLRDAALAYLLGQRLAQLEGAFGEPPEETFLRGIDAAADLGIDPHRAERMLALQRQLRQPALV